MKNIFILSCFLILFAGFKKEIPGEKKVFNMDEDQTPVISRSGDGEVGNFKLHYNTIEEGKEMFGLTGTITDESYYSTRYISGHRCWKTYDYINSLVDSVHGVEMRSRFRDLHLVWLVKIFGPCKWKTTDGFGIGTDIDSIVAKLGKPDMYYGETSWYVEYGLITYESPVPRDQKGPHPVSEIRLSSSVMPDVKYRNGQGPIQKKIRIVHCHRPCGKC